MEDYERTNAREWDLDYKARQIEQAPTNEWQVVDNFKKRDPVKQPQQQRPQQQRQQRQPAPTRPQQPQATPARRAEWKTTSAPKPDQTRRPPPKLASDSDNDAEASWRARVEPTDHIRIPNDLVSQGSYYQQIARQQGTFVFSQLAQGFGGSKTFGIWGEVKAVASTKRAIASWIEETSSSSSPQKSARSAAFAKIESLTPKKREVEEKRWYREVKRQKFRQHPPPLMAFGAIGNFHWPVQEYRPEEILGANYEALDPVRMDCSCYIVFYKERNVFRLMGKASEVQVGLMRMRKTCFQVAARQVSPVRAYLLRWPDATRIPTHVYLMQYQQPAALTSQDLLASEPRHSPRGDGVHSGEVHSINADTQTALNGERVRSLVLRTLGKLHYYRGSIQMRIRRGTFLVGQYRPPKDGRYQVEDYESMTQASQFTGEVTQELGDKATEQALLPALQAAKDLITPSDAMVTELTDVKPVYSAIFTFTDEAGDLRLSIEWQETKDPITEKINFEEISRKWTRLERDTGVPTPVLDISLTDLNTSSAWQFDILASQTVVEARLSQQLHTFALNLRLDPAAAKHQDPARLFVRYNPYANLQSLQQRISYRYTLANSDFTLELSRFQVRTFLSRKFTEPVIYEPRWSLSVFRTQWDTMFTQNERLSIGNAVTWEDDVATWFPSDVGPGCSSPGVDEGMGEEWEQLLQKLGRIEALVAETAAKVEGEEVADLMGGMAIG